ncbi:MAG: ornithine carbamoyltransferase [Verrucomicrobia bacterium]|nr:ornithine carbamoyltransferase [Verrucomicrobiota bacterium]
MKDLLSISDWTAARIRSVIALGLDLKRDPAKYRDAMRDMTLVMLFEKPSLRTRVSFEAGATQMGGHAIYYDLGTSPLGKGKESVEDTARVLSRYADVIMARLFRHRDIVALAKHATVPVINGLTNDEHPTQILADLMTILEKKGRLEGLTLAYLGDGLNNVTHSLMLAAAKVGMNVRIGCPDDPAYRPDPAVVRRTALCAGKTGSAVEITAGAAAAAKGADVVYTDSWMSYHIPEEQMAGRKARFAPYQVNAALMKGARKGAIFMHCLPAVRGCEVTAEVIDGPQSVVFDEAENRLHVHKAIMLHLLDEQARRL